MTREDAKTNLNMISVAFVEPVTKEQRKLIDDTFDMAIKALEQEPCIQEKQANADKIDAVYIDGFKAGYSQARFDLEQEPKYCDRNICLRNEYNGIGCDECEVTKSQEPTDENLHREREQAYTETVTEFADRCRECGAKYGKLLKQEPCDFAKWVASEIFDEMWEYNKDAFAEIACRKLEKLGIVRAKGDEWKLIESKESDHKCHTCKHYTSGEHDGSCGSYICKGYSDWESEE